MKTTIATLRLPAAALFVVCGLWCSCSREEDPATAAKLLSAYLERPESGAAFETFVESWEEVASIESLQEALFDPALAAGKPDFGPEVHLARTWYFGHRESPEAALASYQDFLDSADRGTWLAAQVRRHGNAVVGNLIDGVAEIHQAQPAEENTMLFPDNEFRDRLWPLVEMPALMWPVYEVLESRPWGGEDFARPFLRRAGSCALAKRPEQMFEFLRASPLYGKLPDFDPIDAAGRPERPTLLDEILYHLGHCGQRNRQGLAALLKRNNVESFGRELLIAHLTNPIDEPVNTADLFQETLVEIRKLPPERQQQLAKLASRMTIRLSGDNIDPEGRFREFHQWLSDEGAASPGTVVASSWLGASRFEDLPPEKNQFRARLRELLHTLLARDPELALETMLHINRLDRDRWPPEEYANMQNTVVEEALRSFLYRARSTESRAFLLNTFEAGHGEVCLSFGEELTEWITWDLIDGFTRPVDSAEERLVNMKKRCEKFAQVLRVEDPRILVAPLYEVAKTFPRAGISLEQLAEWAEAEAAAAPDDPVSPVLLQLATAAGLRARIRDKKREPADGDPEEIELLDAITDDTRDWQWRMALAGWILEATEGKMSDAFVKTSAAVLAEGLESGHRLISEAEGSVLRAAYRLPDPVEREAACRPILEGWKKRFLGTGVKSTHRHETILILGQLGVMLGDREATDQIVGQWESASQRPDAVVAMVNVGYLDYAEQLMKENYARFTFPAEYFRRSPDFGRHAGEFVERLAKAGKENPEFAGLDLEARALFYNVPRLEKPGPVLEEAKGIADAIEEAYKATDSPPIPVKRALYLMARSARPPGDILGALQKWFELMDIRDFVENVNEPSKAAVESIKLLNSWRVSKGGGKDLTITRAVLDALQNADQVELSTTRRNTLLDGLLERCMANFRHSNSTGDKLTPERIDEWIEIFRRFASLPSTVWNSKERGREVGYLVAASALVGRSAELQTWWRSLENDHRNALILFGSERFNAFPIVDGIARASKAMKADPALRRDFLIDVLAAPQPRYNMDFVHQWPKDKVATPEQILAWETEILEKAPRSGNSAIQLANLAQEQGQPERALELADRAIADAGNIRLLRSRFQVEKAKLLAVQGNPEEGVAFLKAAMGEPEFHPDMKEKAAETMAELGAK